MTSKLYKAGIRLKSAVSDVQVMMLRCPPRPLLLACGGHEMLGLAENLPADSGTAAAPEGESLIGKRYVDAADTIELLCTKGGAGGLSADGVALEVKQAKALPSSD